ncbi:MAG: hypothetical protein IAF38_18335 [Bacteroidia bacterium]|nr:hypothetical protein [Bacteroidia bacterium]
MTSKNDNEEAKADAPWFSKSDLLWATSPLYKTLLVAFVLHSLFEERRTDSPLMIIIYITLGLIALAQVVGVVVFFRKVKNK